MEREAYLGRGDGQEAHVQRALAQRLLEGPLEALCRFLSTTYESKPSGALPVVLSRPERRARRTHRSEHDMLAEQALSRPRRASLLVSPLYCLAGYIA